VSGFSFQLRISSKVLQLVAAQGTGKGMKVPEPLSQRQQQEERLNKRLRYLWGLAVIGVVVVVVLNISGVFKTPSAASITKANERALPSMK